MNANKLANYLMFKMTDEQCKKLEESFTKIINDLDILEKIDTTNVKAAY